MATAPIQGSVPMMSKPSPRKKNIVMKSSTSTTPRTIFKYGLNEPGTNQSNFHRTSKSASNTAEIPMPPKKKKAASSIDIHGLIQDIQTHDQVC